MKQGLGLISAMAAAQAWLWAVYRVWAMRWQYRWQALQRKQQCEAPVPFLSACESQAGTWLKATPASCQQAATCAALQSTKATKHVDSLKAAFSRCQQRPSCAADCERPATTGKHVLWAASCQQNSTFLNTQQCRTPAEVVLQTKQCWMLAKLGVHVQASVNRLPPSSASAGRQRPALPAVPQGLRWLSSALGW